MNRKIFLALVVTLWSSLRASAQPPVVSLDELRRLLDQQRALIEAQSARLDVQDREIAVLRRQIGEVDTVARQAGRAVAELTPPMNAVTAAAIEQRIAAIEHSVERAPELPAAVVSAGDFPGSIHVPGTDAAIKIGGQARMTLVHTLAPLGVDDRFITSSIPVNDGNAGEESRTTYSPSPSRVNLDVRSPSPIGDLRTFLEADFAGAGNTLRLRHAFMQVKRWTIGQTWSTFSDPEAEPIGIDFEGLNAISMFRQPQVRFTQPVREHLNVSVAIENPAPDLTGAAGVNVTPDFVARLRWEPSAGVLPGPHLLGRTAHVQAAVLVRTLRGEVNGRPETTVSTGGFGANLSGVLVPRWSADDRFKFAANTGWGIGRYITDLGTLGGQDAFYDPATESLTSLHVYSSVLRLRTGVEADVHVRPDLRPRARKQSRGPARRCLARNAARHRQSHLDADSAARRRRGISGRPARQQEREQRHVQPVSGGMDIPLLMVTWLTIAPRLPSILRLSPSAASPAISTLVSLPGILAFAAMIFTSQEHQ